MCVCERVRRLKHRLNLVSLSAVGRRAASLRSVIGRYDGGGTAVAAIVDEESYDKPARRAVRPLPTGGRVTIESVRRDGRLTKQPMLVRWHLFTASLTSSEST